MEITCDLYLLVRDYDLASLAKDELSENKSILGHYHIWNYILYAIVSRGDEIKMVDKTNGFMIVPIVKNVKYNYLKSSKIKAEHRSSKENMADIEKLLSQWEYEKI